MGKGLMYLQKDMKICGTAQGLESYGAGGRVAAAHTGEQTRKVQRAFQISSLGDTAHAPSFLYFIMRYFNSQLSTG